MMSLAHPLCLALGLLLCLPYLLRRERAWQYSAVQILPARARVDVVTLSTAGLTVMAVSLLLLALARPQQPLPQPQQQLQARDIILTLDLSLSMEGHIPTQSGARHQRKLDIVQRAAREFVQSHSSDRLALIVFGDEAFGVWPLSTDNTTILRRLQQLDTLLPAQLRGTRVERALVRSLEHMQELGQASSKIILLLTDGLDTIEAKSAEYIRQRLQRENITLYVLGIQLNENSSVVSLARQVRGGYYAVDKAEEMDKALKEIDQLEKTPVATATAPRYAELYRYFAFPGLLLLLLSTVCKSMWILEV